MPYAYGAKIEHEYTNTHLNIWVTFYHPMNQLIKPDLANWELNADGSIIDIIDSSWQDEHTLLLTSDTIAVRPARLTLAFLGPDQNLKTTWGKQWEPWGAILSTDITSTIFQTGMIILWSGSIATIPSGWQLCDGTNGTPNLQDKFIVGAGSTYAVGATSGSTTHNHSTDIGHNHSWGNTPETPQGPVTAVATIWAYSGSKTSDTKNHLPPYYALCYIVKL